MERAESKPELAPSDHPVAPKSPVTPKGAEAGRPVPPPLPKSALRAVAERGLYRRDREILERRSVLRGLILLAVIAVVIAVLHGGASRAFPAGWWRQW